jgi:hypothetical protein
MREPRPEVGAAGRDFFGFRLVLRRYAAHRIRDDAIDESEAIVGSRFILSLGETERQKSLIKKIARVIAGKRPPRAIGAIAARR